MRDAQLTRNSFALQRLENGTRSVLAKMRDACDSAATSRSKYQIRSRNIKSLDFTSLIYRFVQTREKRF